MRTTRFRSLLVSGLLFSLTGFYLIWQTVYARSHPVSNSLAALPAATLVNDEQRIPAFRLQRLGGTVTDLNLTGRWTLLFFGYTHCPQVCPTELALLRDVKVRLSELGATTPQVVFVSVDGRRDSVELLDKFVHEFDAEFIGATAADDALLPLTKHLGVFYQRTNERSAEQYNVDHTTGIYLVDPRGRLKAVFEPPQQAAEMARVFMSMTRG